MGHLGLAPMGYARRMGYLVASSSPKVNPEVPELS
jgi:hypothetical protein